MPNLLQRIDGPMTRVRIKRLTEALQSLITEVHDKEIALEDSKTILGIFEASSRMITYLYVQDIVQGLNLEKQCLESDMHKLNLHIGSSICIGPICMLEAQSTC